MSSTTTEGACKPDDPGARIDASVVTQQILPYVRRFLRRRTMEHEDLDDLVQEAIIAIMYALPGFRGDASPYTFAAGIAWRILAGRRRRYSRQVVSSALALHTPTFYHTSDTYLDPHEAYLVQQRRTAMAQLMELLPRHQSEVLALRHFDECTIAEIAERIGVSAEAAKSRLRSGHERMRRLLQGDSPLGELVLPNT